MQRATGRRRRGDQITHHANTSQVFRFRQKSLLQSVGKYVGSVLNTVYSCCQRFNGHLVFILLSFVSFQRKLEYKDVNVQSVQFQFTTTEHHCVWFFKIIYSLVSANSAEPLPMKLVFLLNLTGVKTQEYGLFVQTYQKLK